jgi:hypothetical protein
MFAVKIEGRLGNQLFQYAFALAQRERYHEDFYLESYRYRFFRDLFVLPRYFTIRRRLPGSNAFKKLVYLLTSRFKPPQLVQDQWFPADDFLRRSGPGVSYRGFFQAEEYFLPVKDLVREEFRIREKYRIDIRDFTGNDRETIVVHVRRTDYLNWGNDDLGYNLSLPESYYQRCLDLLDTSGKNILFLSDDIAYVKERFGRPGAFFSENNSEITDFQLLMQADYLILSNSSFSWWGAYLNDRAKRVLAPKYWLGFKVGKEWPNGTVCTAWDEMDVLIN